MEVLSKSPEQTKRLAAAVVERLLGGEVVALYGNLGAGKTTFVQGAVEALGIYAKVLSPTFVLMRSYQKASGRIKSVVHVDLYRVGTKNEVFDLGISDIFGSKDSAVLIEWPEIIEDVLPESVIKIKFEFVSESERRIKVTWGNVQNSS